MRKFLTAICAATLLLMTGCGADSDSHAREESAPMSAESAKSASTFPTVTEAKTLNAIKIRVGGKNFSATLEDNPTARAFAAILPLEADMTELNGNEKYFYLPDDLPSAPVSVRQIRAGDLMLFGSNCVVIFYKDFATSYSYTRLGRLESAADLAAVLGAGNVHVGFGR